MKKISTIYVIMQGLLYTTRSCYGNFWHGEEGLADKYGKLYRKNSED